MTAEHPRITIESDKRDGKPCIRGMRITVNDVLGWLANGMTEPEILDVSAASANFFRPVNSSASETSVTVQLPSGTSVIVGWRLCPNKRLLIRTSFAASLAESSALFMSSLMPSRRHAEEFLSVANRAMLAIADVRF